MFSKKKYLHVPPNCAKQPVVRPPKPDDSELPEIPEEKVWFFLDHSRNRTEYSGHRTYQTESWLTVVRLTGYEWSYSPHGNKWVAHAAYEPKVSVRIGGIYQWGLVD